MQQHLSAGGPCHSLRAREPGLFLNNFQKLSRFGKLQAADLAKTDIESATRMPLKRVEMPLESLPTPRDDLWAIPASARP